MIWTFYQSGHIPGISGEFANCRVDVHADNTYEVLPLQVPPNAPPAETTPAKSKRARPVVDDVPAEGVPDIAIEAVPVEAEAAPVEPVAAPEAQKESA